MLKNLDIRELAKKENVTLWKIANHLGFSDITFSRKLRYELSPEEKTEIRKAIREIKEGEKS